MAKKKEPDRVDDLINELTKYATAEELLKDAGLLKDLKKRLIERALDAEMTDHLGYEKHSPEGHGSGNSRNGKTPKRVIDGDGEFEIDVPRDRNGEFEPKLIRKRQVRLPGFDDKVLSLYARGMTTREMQSHLQELYDVEVSPALISKVTDAVLDEVKAWQSRPLDAVWPIVYLDAIHLKIRTEGRVQTRAVYLALGIDLTGQKELLGLWIGEQEGAKFWLGVLTELQNRGVRDILIAAVDGLSGFPDAIASVFPKTEVQLCVVHMVRNSLRYVPWKAKRAMLKDLRPVYQAATVEAAEQALEAFEKACGEQYPMAAPTEDSVRKVLYLAIQRAAKKWTMPVQDWPAAMNFFSIVFEGRVPV